MPFAYAVYWTVRALVVLWLGGLLAKQFGWSMLKAILVLAIPVNYVWDFFVEGIAAAMGWWTYDPGMGPVLRFANGGQITLLWTIGLMCFWPNLIDYWAGTLPVRGLDHFERFFGLERFTRPKPTPAQAGTGHAALTPAQTATAILAPAAQHRTKRQEYDDLLNYEVTIPRWKFELARFGAWFVVFQVSFFVVLVAPLVLLRIITGNDSIYVPCPHSGAAKRGTMIYLPPASGRELVKETILLVGGCLLGILLLGIVVYFTTV